MTVFRHDFRVRYAETDQMGVSYYANYLVWFEMGRAEYFRALGVCYTDYEKQGLFLPVVEAHARYYLPTTYDEKLAIEVAVSEFGKTSMKFVYRILKEDGKKAADGYTLHVFIDRARKPVRVPQEVLQKTPIQSLEC